MLGQLHKQTATLLFAGALLFAVAPLWGADYAASVLRDQPISYFRFEEPAGTPLHDAATASRGTPATAMHDLVQAVPGALRTADAAPNHSARFSGTSFVEANAQSDERGIQNRHRLLQQLERPFDRSIAAESYNFYRQQAFDLLVSPEVRRAFDLRREPASIQHAYGDHLCGQSVLMARRLIEAGVPIVTVMCAFDNLSDPLAEHWDTHSNNFNRLKHTMLPLFDRVFPALLDDLESRGQLDETLVVVIGDFGRTPKINGKVGRDHHPYCYSVVFAGGGIRGGQVYGASDAIGAYPARLPCAPHDLHATVFHALGIPLLSELQDQLDRPRYLCDAGQPLPLF